MPANQTTWASGTNVRFTAASSNSPLHWYSGLQKPEPSEDEPESALDWLDRRVDEVRKKAFA